MANGNFVEKTDYPILEQGQSSGAFETFAIFFQSRFGFGALLLQITPQDEQQGGADRGLRPAASEKCIDLGTHSRIRVMQRRMIPCRKLEGHGFLIIARNS
jgi:hypothetical protein